MDLMDSTQSISVITSEFMQDVGTTRIYDAAKYAGGISPSNLPLLMDGMNIRGFRAIGVTLDGFRQLNLANQDPIIVERLEIVKGPNAILAPQGLPGGMVNYITKKPLFTNKGSVSYQVGRWDADRAELDANYVVRPDKLAVRVVAAFTDSDLYGENVFHQNFTVMPMFTYRISPSTELTLQYQASNARAFGGFGTPVSLYAAGRNNVRVQEGLPRDFLFTGKNITAKTRVSGTRFLLNSQITDKLAVRFAGSWSTLNTESSFLGISKPYLGQTGIVVDPVQHDENTGEWYWDGVTVNNNPTYKFDGFTQWPKRTYGNFQNDFVYEHATTTWKSKTVAGYAFNYESTHSRQRNFDPIVGYYDLQDNYAPPSYTITTANTPWTSNSSNGARSNQVYIYEVLTLFEDHLTLSGSLSQNRYVSHRHNNKTGARGQERREVLLPSGGFVYKITPEISFFYGFSKKASLGQTNTARGIPAHVQEGRQHEGGVRVRLFDGRLYATFSYFDILQENIWREDPRTYAVPAPTIPYPAVNSNRTSKGVEFEIAWSPTQNFSLIGSFTDYKFRDDENMGDLNVAERMAAIWASYTFTEGALRGLRVGLGANYVGERPGEAGEDLWTTSANPVRVQPRFWIPSYTVVEASASYRINKHWHAQLSVHNLLDKDYIVASFQRQILVSTPINPKLTVRYEF